MAERRFLLVRTAKSLIRFSSFADVRRLAFLCMIKSFLPVVFLLSVVFALPSSAQQDDVSALMKNVSELIEAGKYDDAIPIAETALIIQRQTLGLPHSDLDVLFCDLATLYLLSGRFSDAQEMLRLSSELRGTSLPDRQDEIEKIYLKIQEAFTTASKLPNPSVAADEAFQLAQTAQFVELETAREHINSSIKAGTDGASSLGRRWSGIAFAIRNLNAGIEHILSGKPSNSSIKLVFALNTRLQELEKTAADLRLEFLTQNPDYAALLFPSPVDYVSVLRFLTGNEVLVYFAFARDQSFAWMISTKEIGWRRLSITRSELKRKVDILRCGLEPIIIGADASKEICAALGVERRDPFNPPFNLNVAYELYESLLRPFEDSISAKDVIIIPTGPLASLPLHVLVTRPEEKAYVTLDHYKDVAWLGTRYSVSVVPSLSIGSGSLNNQRALFGGKSRAPKPYAGFANPLVTGSLDSDRSAFDKQSCSTVETSVYDRPRAAIARRHSPTSAKRSGTIDTDAVRQLPPLPDTTDEVCAAAKAFNASENDVFLGERATNKNLWDLSMSGELAKYRVLHFATHGIMAGDLDGLDEPALVMSPTQDDSGLLYASKIRDMKLDADWIILSACNTAASDVGDIDGFSGLIAAFFHAGSRALLVSYWSVYSDAAVKVVSVAVSELSRHPQMSHARALQISMTALKNSDGFDAHPTRWAVFSVIGMQ